MKNKVFLPLIEQMCMILLFAVVSAICIRGFTLAKSISAEHRVQDRAVVEVQNVAELIKGCAGDLVHASQIYGGVAAEEEWSVYYGVSWEFVSDKKEAEYQLNVKKSRHSSLPLGEATVELLDGETVVFSLDVAWQEE